MIVRSMGELTALAEARRGTSMTSQSSSMSLYGLNQVYFEIYRTQPNVRICVDFIARNIAHLSLQAFRRVSDTDRVRLNDHELIRWLNTAPAKTRYRLIEDLVTDLGIYFRAFWLKVRHRDGEGRNAIGLVRLPPDEMHVEGEIIPKEFVWTVGGREKRFPPSEIVYFAGYAGGISPLETLRRILAEEAAAGQYRESFWSNSARLEGVWERDKASKRWTPDQTREWREQWQEFARGKAGSTAVGQPGMTYKQTSFNAKDSEFIAGGKLRREICAAQYHIPQPMVGILEHATFTNVKEQHKHLYQDCLGPWNESISQEIERQVLVECADQDNVYLEFNIDAKLAGTPQDRAQAMLMSIGRPWRAVNEGRSLDNLPRIDRPEFDIPAPQQGGPSSNTAPALGSDDEAVGSVIHSARVRQSARLAKFPPEERADAFLAGIGRWNHELCADLSPIVGAELAESLARVAHAQFLSTLRGEADAA